jgi:hypothetical protein
MQARQDTNRANPLIEAKAAKATPPGINSLSLLKFEPQAEKTGARPAAASRQASKKPIANELVTLVKARIDVGLGNALFIRGQGNGLRWDKGQPLKCLAASTWIWSTNQAREKVEFKLLLNDQVWSEGANLVIEPGRQIEVTPSFACGAAR